MILLIVSLYELKQFLQIIMWIAIPATVAAMIITTILHYRYKRKGKTEDNYMHESGSLVMANEVQEPLSEDEYRNVLQTHKKFAFEMENGQQKYDQLHDEFKKLEKKHLELIAKGQSQNGDSGFQQLQKQVKDYEQKIARMEQALDYLRKEETGGQSLAEWREQVQLKERELQQRDTMVHLLEEALRKEREQKSAHATEINKLGNLLKDMEMAVSKATQDKEQSLQEQRELNVLLDKQLKQLTESQAVSGNEHSTQVIILKESLESAQEEKATLKNRLLEQDSMLDVIQEKNLQIGFLQNQLEQRIKSYHQLEYQNHEDSTKLKDLQALSVSMEQEAGSLKEELRVRNQETIQLQERISIAFVEQKELEETLYSRTTYMEQLEGSLQQMKDHNAQLEQQLNGNRESIDHLNEKLSAENNRANELQHKLEFSSQILMKIYKELAKSFGITLNQYPQDTAYINNEKIKEWVFTEPLSGSITHELVEVD